MGSTVNTGKVTSTLSNESLNVTPIYNNYTTVFYSGATTDTHTVGVGKKWIVTCVGCNYNSATSSVYISSGSQYICYDDNSSPILKNAVNCHIVLTAGMSISIVKEGFFTYIELDA